MTRARFGASFTVLAIALVLSASICIRVVAQTAPLSKPSTRLCVICDLGVKVDFPSLPQQMGFMADAGDGYIYATSSSGGVNGMYANLGTIFRFSIASGAVDTLYRFDNVPHGGNPMGGLVYDKAERAFYGTTYQGGIFHFLANGKDATRSATGVVFRYKNGDTAPTVLHAFRNGDMTGIKQRCKNTPVPHCYWTARQMLTASAGYPLSPPVKAADGKYYGVASKAFNYALGILYRVEPSEDGEGISALCVGGTMPSDDEEYVNDQASLARLRDRCMFHGSLGGTPISLTADPTTSVLYGTTMGIAPEAPNGTVFSATLDGRVTTLKNFTDPHDGMQPFGIIVASDGKLYGTTRYGGIWGAGNPGAGVVYRISPGAGGFSTGAGFEVLHILNGVSDGAGSVSQLVEVRTPIIEPRVLPTDPIRRTTKTFLYGTASIAGDGRGTIFRVDPTAAEPTYEVVHRFSVTWQAQGSKPLSTMIASTDPVTGRPVLFGTTNLGGSFNNGALFRLSGFEMPPVAQATNRTILYGGVSAVKPTSITVPGEAAPVLITVETGVLATQFDGDGKELDRAQGIDNIRIDATSCRNPHIIQFIAREKFDVNANVYLGGTFHAQRSAYPFSEGPAHRVWRVDTSWGPPNPFYDEGPGAPRIAGPAGLSITDGPNFVTTKAADAATPGAVWNYIEEAPERWDAVFTDYVICNCKPVAIVNWTREVDVALDVKTMTWQHKPPVYKDVSVVPLPASFDMRSLSSRVVADGYEPIP